MRKVIVAINISLDGFADHTPAIADEEHLNYFNEIMASSDTTIMGRVTHQMMKDYWPEVAKNKSGTESEIAFAEHLERVEKIVVSTTLEKEEWGNARIVKQNIVEEIDQLKRLSGKNILIGGPSLISYLTSKNLIDEFHFVRQPFVLTKGIQLFTYPMDHLELELIDSKQFASGVIASHYRIKPVMNN